jgi:hypothetical protein
MGVRMTEVAGATGAARPEPQPAPASRWGDLALYLGVGLGLFALLGALARVVAGEDTTLGLAGTGLANFIGLAGTVYVFGIRRGRLSWAGLGLFPARWRWRWLLLIAGLTLALIPLRGLISIVVLWLVEGNFDSLQTRQALLGSGFSLSRFAVTLLVAGVLAPISEELFFRGALYTWLRGRYRVWVAALINATLFGLAHYDSLGVVVSSFIMGVVIVLVYEYTRSLWTAIAIHILNNSLAVALLYAVLALLEYIPQLRPPSP